MTKPIKHKKYYDLVVIDNYIIIDNCLVIDKNYCKIDNEFLDAQLKNCTCARYIVNNSYLEYLEQKPTGWENIISSTDDEKPMFKTDCYIEQLKQKYHLLKCDTTEKLEVQGINAEWLEKYIPEGNITYSPSKNHFRVWIDNKLIAIIMPCIIRNDFMRQLVSDINYYRKQELKQC